MTSVDWELFSFRSVPAGTACCTCGTKDGAMWWKRRRKGHPIAWFCDRCQKAATTKVVAVG